ncbi:hypothetical protein Nepgr_019595 [Nepenthes gracilis]|uniref:Secreted protein n=1 Tax=Nepenthes gracilis TaxID=150966 RepID=A0AAD3SVI8_NEPGR|nr:hypothetical protein Nepgr_019595 [Nepenthes gracilis]
MPVHVLMPSSASWFRGSLLLLVWCHADVPHLPDMDELRVRYAVSLAGMEFGYLVGLPCFAFVDMLQLLICQNVGMHFAQIGYLSDEVYLPEWYSSSCCRRVFSIYLDRGQVSSWTKRLMCVVVLYLKGQAECVACFRGRSGMLKTECVLRPEWHLMRIPFEDGSRMGWSTFTHLKARAGPRVLKPECHFDAECLKRPEWLLDLWSTF